MGLVNLQIQKGLENGFKGGELRMSKDAEGMKGYRSRNETGELRRKRSDTHVSTIEQGIVQF